MAILIEHRPGEEECRSLVALAEGLGAGYAESDDGSSDNGVIDLVEGPEYSFKPLEIVGLVEPLVVGPHGSIERNGQRKCRSDQ